MNLGEAKQSIFRDALEEAIELEFGQKKNFSAASGESKSMLSQIFDPDKKTATKSLQKVLKPFSPAMQEKVHKAWVNEYAPLPSRDELLSLGPSLIYHIRKLDQAGNPRRALRIAQASRDATGDSSLWQKLTEEKFQINLRLLKVGDAVITLREMAQRAKINEDSIQQSAVLWMHGSAIRAVDGIGAKKLQESQANALQFLSSWKPSSEEERESYLNRKTAIYRDYALHVLTIHGRQSVSEDVLKEALNSVRKSMEIVDCPLIYCAGLEVRARVETALGIFVAAEESLDELQSLGKDNGTDLGQKIGMAHAHILAARGEKDAAIAKFSEVSEDCLDHMNLHHHRQAQQMIAKLELGL